MNSPNMECSIRILWLARSGGGITRDQLLLAVGYATCIVSKVADAITLLKYRAIRRLSRQIDAKSAS